MIKEFLKVLKETYPQSSTALKHGNSFQLLMATILSAQCTDERVNRVTPVLFSRYPSPEKMAKASLKDLEKLIYSTGFYKNKALSMKESSKAIVSKFKGRVPKTMEELLTLKGVARKTANVVLGNAWGINAGVVVDTHVKRVSFRLGLTKRKDPAGIEKDLMKIVARKDWTWFSNALILHGRKRCRARNPDCGGCPLNMFCKKRLP